MARRRTPEQQERIRARALRRRALRDLAKMKNVELTMVSYDDQLSKDQLIDMFNNDDLQKVEEHVWEWEIEARQYGLDYVYQELGLDAEAIDLLEQYKLLDDIRDDIEDRDESDVFGGLVSRTPDTWFRYWIDACDEFQSDSDPAEYDDTINEACALLGLDRAANEGNFRSLIENACYGGGLYLLWYGDVEDMYNAVFINEQPEDAMLVIPEPELLLLDRVNGSGFSETFVGTATVPFKPEHLSVDLGSYSYAEDIAGLSPNSFKRDPKIVSQFELYRQMLVEFFDYRSKLLPR